MRGFWQAMKAAAVVRHAMVVGFCYAHDRRQMAAAMERHMRFVDFVYAPMGV